MRLPAGLGVRPEQPHPQRGPEGEAARDRVHARQIPIGQRTRQSGQFGGGGVRLIVLLPGRRAGRRGRLHRGRRPGQRVHRRGEARDREPVPAGQGAPALSGGAGWTHRRTEPARIQGPARSALGPLGRECGSAWRWQQ